MAPCPAFFRYVLLATFFMFTCVRLSQSQAAAEPAISQAYLDTKATALSKAESGDTTAGIELLASYMKSPEATPAEKLAARVEMAKLRRQNGERLRAHRLLNIVQRAKPGINDTARSEAEALIAEMKKSRPGSMFPKTTAPKIVPPEGTTQPTDARSAQYKEVEASALAIHKSGDTTAAITMLEAQLETAAPADKAAAHLRLGYLHLTQKKAYETRPGAETDKAAKKGAGKEEGLAQKHFTAAAKTPQGVNDTARADAAFRLAQFSKDRPWLSRKYGKQILQGEHEALPANQVYQVAQVFGGRAHYRYQNLQRSIGYYEAAAKNAASPQQKAEALTAMAGLWFEIAKGEGKIPIDESKRPAAFEKARALCKQVAAIDGEVEPDRRMVVGLMLFETYWFEENYDESYRLGKEFLDRWGTNAAAYSKNNQKQYLNTAITFQMQSAYVTGKLDEAVALANIMLGNPPAEKQEFGRSDCFLYAVAIEKLVAKESGNAAHAAEMDELAKGYRDDGYYSDIEKALERRRAQYQQSAQAQ